MTAEQRWQMGLQGRRFVEQHHSISVLGERLDCVLRRSADSTYPAELPYATSQQINN